MFTYVYVLSDQDCWMYTCLHENPIWNGIFDAIGWKDG